MFNSQYVSCDTNDTIVLYCLPNFDISQPSFSRVEIDCVTAKSTVPQLGIILVTCWTKHVFSRAHGHRTITRRSLGTPMDG